ncbi:hypothetical protein DSAG12_00748 [Promethearchaeum syntrophicum]|uniref:Uncharacterized protein n=1 Tax=Promethearchaeum syntrophicum TaxID=2594042 RepID=A0A5B9D8I4_9ARCH|nr:hypothetical protein [Candidatus Prometheoarchaeum syntrophicum]QEE14926.1 hypothetical protein DSAG12_00748 [Candidatus Prometheoarchaeum syntrophicum]
MSIKNDQDIEIEKIFEGELKKSFFERAISSFLKKQFISGLKILTSRPYIFFFIYSVIIIFASITFGILYALKVPYPLVFFEKTLLVALCSGLSLVIGGFLGGLSNYHYFTNVLTILLFVCSYIIAVFFDISLDFFQWIKLLFLIAYVLIGSMTMFFIIVSFHTSLSYRIITLGNSPNRMFFQELIRFGVWITIPMYIYMFFQRSLDSQILSILGIIINILLLVQMYGVPKTKKGDRFENKENNKVKINFKQILGFYNLYLIFHASQSFNTGGKITNLILEILILALNAFYIINNYCKKIENIDDYDETMKRLFRFQRPSSNLMKFKKRIGDKGMVFMALGVVVGYITVLMNSYLNTPMVLLGSLGAEDVPLNVIYHRMFLYFALILIVLMTVLFKKSTIFRLKLVNRYSIRHAMNMFADIFRVSEDGHTGIIYDAVEVSKQKIEEQINKVGKKFKNGWNKFFSLGGTEESDENAND